MRIENSTALDVTDAASVEAAVRAAPDVDLLINNAGIATQTISTITDKVMEAMAEWQNRPLDRVYPVVSRVRPLPTASRSRRRWWAKLARGARVSFSTVEIHSSRRSPCRPVIMMANANVFDQAVEVPIAANRAQLDGITGIEMVRMSHDPRRRLAH
jgi:NAD(P)-dependent dehydrogenase (short-subunit alcohol dehydrogenase family)